MLRFFGSLILVACLSSAASAQVYVGRGGVHVGGYYGGGVHVGGGYGVRVGAPYGYYGAPYRYGYGVRYGAPYPFYGAPVYGGVGVYSAPMYVAPQYYVP